MRPTDRRRAGLVSSEYVRRWTDRLGPDRLVGLAVAAIVVAAAVGELAPASPGAIGSTEGAGSAPRVAIAGTREAPVGQVEGIQSTQDDPPTEDAAGDLAFQPVRVPAAEVETEPTVEGPFLADGTLLKPVAVDTSVADGRGLLRTYRAASGETVAGIAKKFGISPMTIVWANGLSSMSVPAGKVLTVPPVSGLVLTVTATDTLDALADRYDVEAAQILEANELTDPNLIVGQLLVIPGAKGDPLPTPTPAPAKKPIASTGGGMGTIAGPSQYAGGKFSWPVPGGTISQYFHYGHYAIDIAADYGSTVRAAAGGTVTFAGWKSNGGGYQVWIAHGSGLYTTYNHMSSISVGRGEHVGRGEQVGRVGQSGNATGPHLHFEVWRGPVWDGGRRVNPLGYF
ncbi:MAG: peptidoglycan DD-metalloendopeptidase family protein [Chloroflexota bacterium]